jgi:hypothetical protein
LSGHILWWIIKYNETEVNGMAFLIPITSVTGCADLDFKAIGRFQDEPEMR